MTISPVLARALAAGRPQFNARVAAARRERSGFDVDALAEAIRLRLDPVVVAVDAVAPDRTSAVVDAGFDLIVTLAGQNFAGARSMLINQLWREVAVAYVGPVAQRPFATLALLINAALKIEATPGARAGEWIDRMIAIAPLVDADTLAGAGQVVAWRSGMAHFREGAIAVADGLPEALALAAIGATDSWADVRAALIANPWWTPEVGSAPEIRFGGFSGFGGPFVAPPQVRASGQGFFVRSGEYVGLLVADVWGATLHPATGEEFDAANDDGAGIERGSINGTRIMAGDRAIEIDLPPEGLSVAANATSVAVASAYSHYVRVMPWRLP